VTQVAHTSQDRLPGSSSVRTLNRYTLLGVGLVLSGVSIALVGWLLTDYTPLTAIGTAVALLGIIATVLGRSLPSIPPETALILLEASFDNVAALVEELGLRSRALYLPRSMTNGTLRALIPLHHADAPPDIGRQVPQRMITHFGPQQQESGLLVATPGSAVVDLHQAVLQEAGGDLERLLSTFLVGTLDVADGVHLQQEGQVLTVEVIRPIFPDVKHPAYQVLGSPIASIVAGAAAETLGQPVTILSERWDGKLLRIELRTVGVG
jgi:hypothetical protein